MYLKVREQGKFALMGYTKDFQTIQALLAFLDAKNGVLEKVDGEWVIFAQDDGKLRGWVDDAT